jgi:hypothetical protein
MKSTKAAPKIFGAKNTLRYEGEFPTEKSKEKLLNRKNGKRAVMEISASRMVVCAVKIV